MVDIDTRSIVRAEKKKNIWWLGAKGLLRVSIGTIWSAAMEGMAYSSMIYIVVMFQFTKSYVLLEGTLW